MHATLGLAVTGARAPILSAATCVRALADGPGVSVKWRLHGAPPSRVVTEALVLKRVVTGAHTDVRVLQTTRVFTVRRPQTRACRLRATTVPHA